MEVITQVSTSLFSTTKLPPSITLESSSLKQSVQLSADELQSIKESYLASNVEPTQSPSGDLSPSGGQLDGVFASKPGAGIIWDKPYLSSLKESFESSISAASSNTNPNRPENDLNLPNGGPDVIRPPEDPSAIRPSKPVTDDNKNDAIEISSGSGSGSQPIDLDTSQSQSSSSGSSNSNTANSNANDSNTNDDSQETSSNGGGIINAVVGGIADGLGLGGSSDDDVSSGIQVDLGPVLDAVATLLRGPIRSAIANRRSEFLKRSDEPNSFSNIKATRRVVLPKVARERGNEPNFIPIGNNENPFLRQQQSPPLPSPSPIPLRELVPQQRNANGNVLQAVQPRVDIESKSIT